jgi:hypothetical protein
MERSRSPGLDSSEDLYALLGVPSNVREEELRQTWRRIAMRWHPDRAGQNATAIFQLLSAAYDILSDPISRAVYDRRRHTLNTASRRPPTSAATDMHPTESTRRRTPAVMLSRLSGPLVSLIACGVATFDEQGVIILRVNESEAAEGGFATISLQVDVRCPECSGGVVERPACRHCGGKRTERALFSAWLTIPPGVMSGEVLSPSVELPGTITPVRFRVRLEADERQAPR